MEPARAVAQPEAGSVQPAEPLLDSAGAVLVHRGARAAPGQSRGPPADSWWSGTACREERPQGRTGGVHTDLGTSLGNHIVPQLEQSHSHCKGAKNCLFLQSVPKLPSGIQGTRCSSPRGSDLHLLLDEVEPPFLFSFLRRGSGGCSRSILKSQPSNKIGLGTGFIACVAFAYPSYPPPRCTATARPVPRASAHPGRGQVYRVARRDMTPAAAEAHRACRNEDAAWRLQRSLEMLPTPSRRAATSGSSRALFLKAPVL